MSQLLIRKKSGDVVELDSDEPLTVDELKQLCEEDDSESKGLLNQLIRLVGVLQEQVDTGNPAPVVNVEAPRIELTPNIEIKQPKAWEIVVTEWNKDGRIQKLKINAT